MKKLTTENTETTERRRVTKDYTDLRRRERHKEDPGHRGGQEDMTKKG